MHKKRRDVSIFYLPRDRLAHQSTSRRRDARAPSAVFHPLTSSSTMRGATAPWVSFACLGVTAAVILVVQHVRGSDKKKYPMTRTPLKRVPLKRLPKLENDLVLRAAQNMKTSRVPVWCMRQAGRYVGNFMFCRYTKNHNTLAICRNFDSCENKAMTFSPYVGSNVLNCYHMGNNVVCRCAKYQSLQWKSVCSLCDDMGWMP